MGFIWAQLLAALLISASAGHLRCPLVPSAATGLTLSHAQSYHPINAVTCYLYMSLAPCKPDALTCSFFLKACVRSLARIESLQMHARVLKCGFDADVLLQTTLLDAYAKCGDLDNACKLFDEMSKRDIVCWNALISGLAQGNRPYEALKLFDRMSEGSYGGRGVMMPNEITVLGAIKKKKKRDC